MTSEFILIPSLRRKADVSHAICELPSRKRNGPDRIAPKPRRKARNAKSLPATEKGTFGSRRWPTNIPVTTRGNLRVYANFEPRPRRYPNEAIVPEPFARQPGAPPIERQDQTPANSEVLTKVNGQWRERPNCRWKCAGPKPPLRGTANVRGEAIPTRYLYGAVPKRMFGSERVV